MEIALALFVFVLGTFIGSFLNVVILRHNTGRTVGGRSSCATCGKTLRWFELIPLISFIVQRGRCRTCGARMSIQYPLVEAGTGILFLAVVLQNWPIAEMAVALLAVSLLVVIFVYDLRHMIIPDLFVWMLVGVGFVSLFISSVGGFELPSLSEMLAGPLLAAPFALIWLLSSGAWMGLGDAKLTLGLGMFLGVRAGLAMLLYAFWIGALASLALVLVQRLRLSSGENHLTMKSEVPFGPFLILAFLFVFLVPHISLAPLTYLQL